MKAAFIPYIIFLPLSPVGREGSESWNKAVGTHGEKEEEEEEATIRRMLSVVPNCSFPPEASRCSRVLSSSYVIKCFYRVCSGQGYS